MADPWACPRCDPIDLGAGSYRALAALNFPVADGAAGHDDSAEECACGACLVVSELLALEGALAEANEALADAPEMRETIALEFRGRARSSGGGGGGSGGDVDVEAEASEEFNAWHAVWTDRLEGLGAHQRLLHHNLKAAG